MLTPLPLFMEVKTMLEFLAGCTGLFTDTFNAVCDLDYFQFLAAFLAFEVCFGLFLFLFHGSKKL